jgi:hypothetical protein
MKQGPTIALTEAEVQIAIMTEAEQCLNVRIKILSAIKITTEMTGLEPTNLADRKEAEQPLTTQGPTSQQIVKP